MTTSFKGLVNYGDSLTTTQLETNLSAYIQWGFLNLGGFSSVYKIDDFSYTTEVGGLRLLTQSGSEIVRSADAAKVLNAYGVEPAYLRPVTDPNYIDGSVFEGYRQNWIWERNIDYTYQPIAISGVYVDGNFLPNNTSGAYAFNIDYPQGRVVFTSPLSGNPRVSAEYSFKHVRVDLADSPWFQQIQFNSYRVDDPEFALSGSGAWNILAANRVQLPAIIIEPVLKVSRKGYGLGDYTVIHSQDVRFSILAETDFDRKQIHDILIQQEEATIQTFDKDLLFSASGNPLDSNGFLTSSNPLNYKQIVQSGEYAWKSNIRFGAMRSHEVISDPPLWQASVLATFDMYLA